MDDEDTDNDSGDDADEDWSELEDDDEECAVESAEFDAGDALGKLLALITQVRSTLHSDFSILCVIISHHGVRFVH